MHTSRLLRLFPCIDLTVLLCSVSSANVSGPCLHALDRFQCVLSHAVHYFPPTVHPRAPARRSAQWQGLRPCACLDCCWSQLLSACQQHQLRHARRTSGPSVIQLAGGGSSTATPSLAAVLMSTLSGHRGRPVATPALPPQPAALQSPSSAAWHKISRTCCWRPRSAVLRQTPPPALSRGSRSANA